MKKTQSEENRNMAELLRRIAAAPLFPCDDARNLANLEFYKREAANLLHNLKAAA